MKVSTWLSIHLKTGGISVGLNQILANVTQWQNPGNASPTFTADKE